MTTLYSMGDIRPGPGALSWLIGKVNGGRRDELALHTQGGVCSRLSAGTRAITEPLPELRLQDAHVLQDSRLLGQQIGGHRLGQDVLAAGERHDAVSEVDQTVARALQA